MLGFQIWIRLDPDFFISIRIRQGAMGVCGAIFKACIPIGILVVANPPDLRPLMIYGSTAQRTVALKRPIFKREKGFANLNLGLIYYSVASSQPSSRDTVPLNEFKSNKSSLV
jgi:hypothetical protein